MKRRDNVLGDHSGSFFSFSGGVDQVHCSFRGGVGTHLNGASGLSLELGMVLMSGHNPGRDADDLFSDMVGAGPMSTPVVFPSSKAASCVG